MNGVNNNCSSPGQSLLDEFDIVNENELSQSTNEAVQPEKENADVPNEVGDNLSNQFINLEFDKEDAKQLLGGSEVNKTNRARALAQSGSVKKRDGFFVALGKTIGRKLMAVAHVVKSIFNGNVFKSSWQSNNVKNFDTKLANQWRTFAPRELPALQDPPTEAIPVNKAVVAAMCGFKAIGKATSKPMFKDNKVDIFPNGSPKLADVVQDPALQDCWFLSGITSKLAAEGPEALKRLIDYTEGNSFCTVRMGNKQFKVELSDVCCEGKTVTSSSAPWVRILEQAAAMYLNEKSNDPHGVQGMIYGGMGTAQAMLSGFDSITKFMDLSTTDFKINKGDILDKLKTAFHCNIPVEIGHVNGNASTAQKIAGIFSDAISPGHAVALLDIQEDEKKNTLLTVLDPYGHTRILSADALERCDVQFGVTEEEFNSRKDASEDGQILNEADLDLQIYS